MVLKYEESKEVSCVAFNTEVTLRYKRFLLCPHQTTNLPQSCPGLEVVIITVSLSTLLISNNNLDIISSLVGSVSTLKSTGILGTNGSKDSVGLLHGLTLLRLIRNSTRVEKNERILLSGNSSEISSIHGRFKGSDALSVDSTCAGLGGSRFGSVCEGEGGESGENSGGGGDLGGGHATVHVEGGGGTLLM
jgi:hypothetical protein